jgi:hypothetical protein
VLRVSAIDRHRRHAAVSRASGSNSIRLPAALVRIPRYRQQCVGEGPERLFRSWPGTGQTCSLGVAKTEEERRFAPVRLLVAGMVAG